MSTLSQLPDLISSLLSYEKCWTNEEAKLAQVAAAALQAIQKNEPWFPISAVQLTAIQSEADVLGFGGAAGGGKTDLLLGLALTQHTRTILFRREASQGRSILDRAREILGNVGRLNETLGVWRDLPGGRQIEFAGVKDAGDEQKHRGRPHDFIGFDEADQFSEFQVRFLQGWLRTTKPGQRCRVVLCFNPPASAEGRWLLTYFGPWVDRKHPRPARPGELRWYATLPDGKEVERPSGTSFTHGNETITPRSRTFIPAKVQDNPALMNTGYLATLQALPEPLRSQVLHGDFSAGLEDEPWQIIPTAWVEAAQSRWKPRSQLDSPPLLSALGVDVARGGADKTVICKRYGHWFAPLLKYPGRSTPDGPAVAQLVIAAWQEQPRALVAIDLDGPGSSPFDWLRRLQPGIRLMGVRGGLPVDARDRTGTMSFFNVRAFMYWSMRELLDPAYNTGVMLPPDPELLADLTAPRWEMTTRGVKVEAKEEVIKRLGRSPDAGDALAYSILLPSGQAVRS